MKRTGREPAAERPVARLMVDVPLPHLDRPFDYLVPEQLSDAVQAGSRVRVRFAGRLVDGFVLERRDSSEHDGRLAFLERAVGVEPVLTADTTRLFRAVADRYGGSFVDVVRLGAPARHAGAEASTIAAPWPSCPTGATWPAWTQRCTTPSDRAGTSRCRPTWARASGTGAGWPHAGAPCGQ